MKKTAAQINAEARFISEGMRALDEEGFDAVRASVRKNMAAMKRHAAYLIPKVTN